MQLCQALGCIPVRHNWKILNRVLKKDEEGLGPKIPPRPSESLLKWDIVLAPEWLPKNNANAHCLYNTNCSTAVFSVHPNSIGAPPRQAGRPPYLQIGIKMHSHPRPHHITPNSTTLICQKGHTFLGQGQFRYDLWNMVVRIVKIGDKSGQEKGGCSQITSAKEGRRRGNYWNHPKFCQQA